jgi:hypothetical protein
MWLTFSCAPYLFLFSVKCIMLLGRVKLAKFAIASANRVVLVQSHVYCAKLPGSLLKCIKWKAHLPTFRFWGFWLHPEVASGKGNEAARREIFPRWSVTLSRPHVFKSMIDLSATTKEWHHWVQLNKGFQWDVFRWAFQSLSCLPLWRPTCGGYSNSGAWFQFCRPQSWAAILRGVTSHCCSLCSVRQVIVGNAIVLILWQWLL